MLLFAASRQRREPERQISPRLICLSGPCWPSIIRDGRSVRTAGCTPHALKSLCPTKIAPDMPGALESCMIYWSVCNGMLRVLACLIETVFRFEIPMLECRPLHRRLYWPRVWREAVERGGATMLWDACVRERTRRWRAAQQGCALWGTHTASLVIL